MPPGPLLRRGPRPLLLHLTLAMLKSSASVTASQSLNGGWPGWSGGGAAEQVRGHRRGGAARRRRPARGVSAGGPGRGLRQDRDLIAGIAAYRRHPWRRDLPDPPVLWTEGGSRLLDYGGAGPTPCCSCPA